MYSKKARLLLSALTVCTLEPLATPTLDAMEKRPSFLKSKKRRAREKEEKANKDQASKAPVSSNVPIASLANSNKSPCEELAKKPLKERAQTFVQVMKTNNKKNALYPSHENRQGYYLWEDYLYQETYTLYHEGEKSWQ